MRCGAAVSRIGPETALGRALRWPLAPLRRARVRVLLGPLSGMRWMAAAGIHSCWLGTYEHAKQTMFLAHLAPGSVVYDVGAHAGYYTLLAASRVAPGGRVYAFEPVSENLAYLRHHLRLNRVTNASVVPAAVANSCGSASFRAGTTSSTGHLAEDGQLQVSTVGLDEMARAGLIEAPSLVKIDVEGAEESVLAGAVELLQSARPTVFVATHGRSADRACCELLGSLQYDIEVFAADPGGDNRELLARPRR